jgi:hypothetical protein
MAIEKCVPLAMLYTCDDRNNLKAHLGSRNAKLASAGGTGNAKASRQQSTLTYEDVT